MHPHTHDDERGLLDAALFADEPDAPPDLTAVAVETLAPPSPTATTVYDNGSSYSLTHLAPGLYEVTEPAAAPSRPVADDEELPSPVRVEFPNFDLGGDTVEIDPPSYEWPEEEEEIIECVAEEEEPRRPLNLAVNAGLTLAPGDSVVLTADLLRLAGDDPFLLDVLVLSAPTQGALLRDGFALTGGDVFTQEDIDHGRISYRHEGEIGEDGFVFATPAEEVPATVFPIRVEAARLAPELLAPGHLASPTDGGRVADLLGGARSHEAGVAPGMALVGATGSGQWEYSLDGGASWQPIGEARPDRAFLLGPTHTIRFLPRRGWAGRVRLTYRAWDRSAGEAGERVNLADPLSVGGATAFSASAASVLGVVRATPIRASVPEPWEQSATVADLVGDSAAVVRLEGGGVWQFSLDGGQSWQDFGAVFHGRARVLRGADRVRFLPSRGASGRVAIAARPWDGAGYGAGAVVDLAGHKATGDGTAFGELAQTRAWRLGAD